MLHYYTGDQIQNNEMFVVYGTYGEGRGACLVLVGKPEGKRRSGKPCRRWEYNTTTGFQGTVGGGVKWFYLAQDRDM